MKVRIELRANFCTYSGTIRFQRSSFGSSGRTINRYQLYRHLGIMKCFSYPFLTLINGFWMGENAFDIRETGCLREQTMFNLHQHESTSTQSTDAILQVDKSLLRCIIFVFLHLCPWTRDDSAVTIDSLSMQCCQRYYFQWEPPQQSLNALFPDMVSPAMKKHLSNFSLGNIHVNIKPRTGNGLKWL